MSDSYALPSFTPAQRAALLRAARLALECTLLGTGSWPEPQGDRALRAPGAAFVTLTLGGRLRGCIGSLDWQQPLDEVIARCAVSSATSDPRFYPLTAAELPSVRIEISVLTPLRQVEAIEEIEVGRHGLVVARGLRRGLLLPQVARDYGWTREVFLAQTCLKAGLPTDAWRADAELYLFEAAVFGEDEPSRATQDSGLRTQG